MSSSTNARISRGAAPAKRLTRRNYRKVALQPLRRDFEDRCAYSCQHLSRAGGLKCMEIDHFDPREKEEFIQRYANLFLATRHCNGAKGQEWPSAAERALGLRYLDPCQEQDYGQHMIEDPQTYRLVGLSPAGKYHIRMCDLNAEHFVAERRERSEIWELLRAAVSVKRNEMPQLAADLAAALRQQAEKMIPELPAAVRSALG
jgi:hypothetical protein